MGGTAFAATDVVDFTSKEIGDVKGATELSYTGTDGTVFDVKAVGGKFNSDLFDDSQSVNDPDSPPCDILACAVDGLGISDDEVTTFVDEDRFMEMIEITADTAIDLAAVWVVDLFPNPQTDAREVALLGQEGGFLVEITAEGDKSTNFNGLTIEKLDEEIRIAAGETFLFSVEQGNDDDTQTDAALAGFQYTPVPLPAAGWMLLAGLGGIAAMKRRRKS